MIAGYTAYCDESVVRGLFETVTCYEGAELIEKHVNLREGKFKITREGQSYFTLSNGKETVVRHFTPPPPPKPEDEFAIKLPLKIEVASHDGSTVIRIES